MTPPVQSKNIPAISLTWDEGRYWDLWMFVHFVSGTILGIIIGLFDFLPLADFGIAMLLMVLWELFEAITDIHEVFENRMLDIVIGALGFFAVHLFLPADRSVEFIILMILAAILSALEFLGWKAYTKRQAPRT